MTSVFNAEWWKQSWSNRRNKVESVYGPTEPSGQVTSFRFSDPKQFVPGACAMRFERPGPRGATFYMTLGLTQPNFLGGQANSWEFAVFASAPGSWPNEVLYDLVSGHSEHPGWLEEGHCLPLTFFINSNAVLDATVASTQPPLKAVGEIRSLYLWRRLVPPVSVDAGDGPFFPMVATGITSDEELAGDETSPPHVLLLLHETGVGQVTDPMRGSALKTERGCEIWKRIKGMSHDSVVRALQSMT